MTTKMKKYVVMVMHMSEPIERSLEFHIFATKNELFSGAFEKEIDVLCTPGFTDKCVAIPVNGSAGLKKFANYLLASAARIHNTAEVEHQKEINRNQIPLPIERGE